MPQQLLYGTDIVTCLKKMIGKAVPKGMRADRFVYLCKLHCRLDRTLKPARIQMMAANDPTAWIG